MGRGKRRHISIGRDGRQLSEFKQLEDFFGSLRARGVETVSLFYYGGGEEYNVDQITLTPEQDTDEQLERALDAAIEAVLDIGASGWNNDEGSSGTATFDVGAGTVMVEHNWYEEGTNETSATYPLDELEQMRQAAAAGQREWLASSLGELAPFFTALEARGLTTVTAHYNGGGDSGQIEDVSGEAPGHEDRLEELLSGLDVEELALTIVSLEHAGWENNSGGTGSVIFDAQAKEVRLEHADYEIEERADPFALEGFIPFEIIKLKRGPRSRPSALATD